MVVSDFLCTIEGSGSLLQYRGHKTISYFHWRMLNCKEKFNLIVALSLKRVSKSYGVLNSRNQVYSN